MSYRHTSRRKAIKLVKIVDEIGIEGAMDIFTDVQNWRITRFAQMTDEWKK